MIQRIQTIWLFLAALTLALMIFFPLFSKESAGAEATFYTDGLHTTSGTGGTVSNLITLFGTNILLALICFFNIFNFKRRSLQKRISIFLIILIIGFAVWCSTYTKDLPGGVDGASFGIGAYMPAVAILFIILAIFGINKDERLIRSAERLR